jgi:16S rRNA processing protein RimM
VRPHGLRGAVVVRADPSALTVLQRGLRAALVDEAGAVSWTTIRHVTLRGDDAIVETEASGDRNAAEALVGRAIATERTSLPAATGTEIYEHDVIGLEVYSPAGVLLGSIVEILATGANDVWVVRGSGGELLVPAVAHAILELDAEHRRAIVDPDAAVASD